MGRTPAGTGLRLGRKDQSRGQTGPPPSKNDGLPQEEQSGGRNGDHGTGGRVDQLIINEEFNVLIALTIRLLKAFSCS